MAIKFTNNASSKLTQALTADATSMQIKAEDVSKFPVLGAEDYCLLTIVGDNSNHEIVKVTNISSDGICTIERAQDSTTAKEWPIENRVELRITSAYLNNTTTKEDVVSLISPIEEDISNINNNISSIETNVSTIESKHDSDIEAVNTSIASVQKSIEDNVSQLEQNISDVNTSLTASINSVNTSLTESINTVESTLADSINSVKEESAASYVKKIGDTLTGPLYGVTAPAEATKELVTAEWVQTNSPKTPISSAVDSESETTAASSKAVKIAYDKAVEAADKSGLPLGYIFTWPFSTPPEGCIIANGAEYSAELYKDLWDYVEKNCSPMASFSEWDVYASSHNGYCPFYASDNGEGKVFRTPKFAPFQQLAVSSDNAGTYHEAGLPTINARASGMLAYQSVVLEGSFKESWRNMNGAFTGGNTTMGSVSFNLDPSLSSSVYGKSSTVQPESTEWIVCIVAINKATNIGSADVADVMSAISNVQSDLVNYVPITGGTITGQLNFNLEGTNDHIGDIIALNDSNGKRLIIDTFEIGDQGAFIELRKGSDTLNPGGFTVAARTKDGSSIMLIGGINGQLVWDNKHIVRSVNGTKAGVDGNVDIVSTAVPNEYYWYRIWTDGWKEQGGNVSTQNTNITFLVPFSNTRYTLVGVDFRIDGAVQQVVTKRTTGFSTSSIAKNCETHAFYACGY